MLSHLTSISSALSVNSDTSVWVLDLCASGNEPPCLWEMVWYRDNKKTELVPGVWGRGASYILVADELSRTGQVSLLPDPQMVHL